MKLDITGNSNLCLEHIKKLNDISVETRKNYSSFIDEQSKINGVNINWWVTPLASRNIYSSDLYINCCLFDFVRDLIENNHEITEIIVSNKGLCKVIRKYLQNSTSKTHIKYKSGLPSRLSRTLKPLTNISSSIYHSINQFIFSKIFPATKRKYDDENITLVDTFVYRNSFSGSFHDRHYPGMLDNLDDKDKQNIYLLPTIYKVKNYYKIIKKIRKSDTNFILKEDYLKFRDYLYSYLEVLKTINYFFSDYVYNGHDLAPMVREDLKKNLFLNSSIDALLKYRLAMRLSIKNQRIKCVIDWFENQEIDHGLNAGFRKYYPDTILKGYQGFVATKNYMCMFPTKQEFDHKVIPEQICVMGDGHSKRVKEFCGDLAVKTVPAYRYANIRQERKTFADMDYFTVLVALPILEGEACDILTTISNLIALPEFEECNRELSLQLFIKAHPSYANENIKSMYPGAWPKSLQFMEGEFIDCAERSDLVISSASSVCLESVARGIPVIVLASQKTLCFNPIPEDVSEDIHKLCYTPDGLINEIRNFAANRENTRMRYQQISNEIIEKYYMKITDSSVREFLCLDI